MDRSLLSCTSFLLAALLAASSSTAQDNVPTTDTSEVYIRPYGSFRGHFAVYNDEMELQQNGSRVGFELGYKRKGIRYFAGSELALNMFRGDARFSASASTSSGFLLLDVTQESQVFATRLGYIGADFGKAGVVTIGKTNGVYYDVSGYTDRFNVFGGQASATYTSGSDGGTLGTGRADQVVKYNNTFGILTVGAQAQVRSASNGQFADALGASLQVRPAKGLKLGGAVNQAFLADGIVEGTLGMSAVPFQYVMGANWANEHWDIAVTYADQTNADFTQQLVDTLGLTTVVFDATGLEVFAKYKTGRWAVLAGFNGYTPTVDNALPISKDFLTRYYVVGGEYHTGKQVYVYAEARIDDSVTATGKDGFDVFTLGLRFDFDKLYSRKVVRLANEPY